MIREEGERLVVEGPITMETAAGLLEVGRTLCGGGKEMSGREIDLSGVTAVDSAALALVLAWMRATQRCGRPLRLAGAPEQLRSLADLYGLGEILPLGEVRA
ncbi:MAG: STAS domain-containing protein [Betaproteobacteria bacterium]|nr:STAS domain-containing protein [Betaproteobacteria bacterium]